VQITRTRATESTPAAIAPAPAPVRLPAQKAAEEFLEQTPWANPAHPSHANAAIPRFHAQTALGSSPLASPRGPQPAAARGKSPAPVALGAPAARLMVSTARAGDAPAEPTAAPVARRAPNSTERIQTTHASSLTPAPPAVDRPREPVGGDGSGGGGADRLAIDAMGEQMRLENMWEEQRKAMERKKQGLDPRVDWQAAVLKEDGDVGIPRGGRMFTGPPPQCQSFYAVPGGGPNIRITDWMDMAWARQLVYVPEPEGPGRLIKRHPSVHGGGPSNPATTSDAVAAPASVYGGGLGRPNKSEAAPGTNGVGVERTAIPLMEINGAVKGERLAP
jgi:hypothetical protein